MHEIEEGLAVLQTEDHYNLCTADAMSAMKADFVKQQRKKAINMVKLVKPLNNRKEAFEPHFRKLEQHLHGLVNYIQPKWGVYLELSAGVDPLDEPIRLMVDDPQLHSALTRTMTLNHSIAALILQLAINIAIGSQFIIIDTLDAFVEPCLIEYVEFSNDMTRAKQNFLFWQNFTKIPIFGTKNLPFQCFDSKKYEAKEVDFRNSKKRVLKYLEINLRIYFKF